MAKDDAPLLEKLLETLEEVKEWIRKAHETEKDLKTAIAEARQLRQEIIDESAEFIKRVIVDETKSVKPAFQRALDKALEVSDQRIGEMVGPLMETLEELGMHYSKLLQLSESGKEGMILSLDMPINPKLIRKVKDAERRNRDRGLLPPDVKR